MITEDTKVYLVTLKGSEYKIAIWADNYDDYIEKLQKHLDEEGLTCNPEKLSYKVMSRSEYSA